MQEIIHNYANEETNSHCYMNLNERNELHVGIIATDT